MLQIRAMLLCLIPQSDATIFEAAESDTPESDTICNAAAFDAHVDVCVGQVLRDTKRVYWDPKVKQKIF